MICIFRISDEIFLRWIPDDYMDDKVALAQVMVPSVTPFTNMV